jgi:peptidyl-prolyl cis-trans isomerase B (cyclophilin B)
MNSFSPVKRIVLMRVLGLVVACAVVLVLVAINSRMHSRQPPAGEPPDSQEEKGPETGANEQLISEEASQTVEKHKDKLAVIETSSGTIKFRFYPEDAPRTVENFVQLAEKGFYNGSPFHRIVKDFVIQTGSPDGSPGGGPGYTIPAEFSERKHVEGTVAMARKAQPDSAGSQFYICVKPTPQLDGKYTVFGQVVEGMDVVNKIAEMETDAGSRPLERVVMESVRIEDSPESTAPEQ